MSVPAVTMHPLLWDTSMKGWAKIAIPWFMCRTSNFFLGGNFSRDVALLWFTSFMFCAPLTPGS